MTGQGSQAGPVRAEKFAGQLLSKAFELVNETCSSVEVVVRTISVAHVTCEKLSDLIAGHVLRWYKVETLLRPPFLVLVDEPADLCAVARAWSAPGFRAGLDSSSAASPGSTGSVVGYRCDVFDSTDAEAVASEHSDSCLCAGTWGPCPMSPGCSYPDVERGYALVLGYFGRGGRGLHCRVRCSLQTVRLDMLPTGTSRYRLGTGQVGDMDHCVVEG